MKKITLFAGGLLLAVVLLTAIRFFTLQPPQQVHYHANFALFIEGQRYNFTDPHYSEEVSNCSVEGHMSPEQRTHFHDEEPDILHVHDSGVTWGHFLANLGLTLGPDVLEDDHGNIYTNTGDKKLTFILNGKAALNISNTQIEDEDRLLISYSSQDVPNIIAKEYSQVASNAAEFDNKPDPESCSGGDANWTFWQRLVKALWY